MQILSAAKTASLLAQQLVEKGISSQHRGTYGCEKPSCTLGKEARPDFFASLNFK